MKKFEGMTPPVFVFADEGKNGDEGPPPSCAMLIGGTSGLTMRSFGLGCDFAHRAADTGSTTRNTVAACIAAEKPRAPGMPDARCPHAYATTMTTPTMDAAMCALSAQRSSRILPVSTRYAPNARAAAMAAEASSTSGRPRNSASRASSSAPAAQKMMPMTRWARTLPM